jgi:hypothetical protein
MSFFIFDNHSSKVLVLVFAFQYARIAILESTKLPIAQIQSSGNPPFFRVAE